MNRYRIPDKQAITRSQFQYEMAKNQDPAELLMEFDIAPTKDIQKKIDLLFQPYSPEVNHKKFM